MTQQTSEKSVHRLTPEAYRQLERMLPPPGCPKDGTQAAFNLGVQHVLAVLRGGFVAE